MNIVTHLLTGKDNQTYDIARVAWFVGMMAVLLVAGYQVITHGMVSLRELAESLGIVSASGGASVWAKKDAEPQ
ncbi:hypothetical protein UFOVP1614_18 [uncultured Caudovirales phage]|uniref:Uncharacterized protein n=1 Tax=uncultured Caudovirales phage TaxID=2100421 RepID=A0A6J5SXL7_9CAUD|nr:hypothetical protein UFOVP508_3 [uncultured Caudovirales phage]CAB4177958.1 hypothetical protein UFOVP1012_10 [uncultured Caudovirales phage]CAB4187793.1 hypothetical protein UFOVP1164_5 [uncultured Caudovirales phage]CAB4219361.1 hypothetical protein UFOVP1614_18 [uncultured Caudovirales phage]